MLSTYIDKWWHVKIPKQDIKHWNTLKTPTPTDWDAYQYKTRVVNNQTYATINKIIQQYSIVFTKIHW